jgi:hypothetical protein
MAVFNSTRQEEEFVEDLKKLDRNYKTLGEYLRHLQTLHRVNNLAENKKSR